MKILRFQAGHLDGLILQSAQQDMADYMSRDYGVRLAQAGDAFTAIKDGRVLGCAGVERVWCNRGVAWSLLGRISAYEFLAVHRCVAAFLKGLPLRRVEMTVDSLHAPGHRWASLLGFQHEGTLRAYTPDGRDCDLYARIS
ncbi:hypothetical protein [Pelagibius sp. Alg239-R121]|uniref:hypothetical protein n=1 Tax=Pelagibius sp. Alg239-R121 TaxID=2993448 RepID=UPI0024A73F81|nr:hypothetical protein [Pelagibius sp. Alg239-R121]